jgi:excisionase family DNA binding protein
MTILMKNVKDTQTNQARQIAVPSFAANVHIPLSEFRPERLLDSAEAAAILGIHVKTFQRMARAGQIHGVRVGKLWRFRSSEIAMWIERKLAS